MVDDLRWQFASNELRAEGAFALSVARHERASQLNARYERLNWGNIICGDAYKVMKIRSWVRWQRIVLNILHSCGIAFGK
jgi:hypothetical protein